VHVVYDLVFSGPSFSSVYQDVEPYVVTPVHDAHVLEVVADSMHTTGVTPSWPEDSSSFMLTQPFNC
jgi:hypothetical protein